MFRSKKENKGKVLQTGVWAVVRHPNFLGFTIWRVAFATACGGWVFGLSLLGGFVWLLANTSFPVLEGYMERSYGKRWEEVRKRVAWKMIPGVW
jgi:protein-S-isoprenylcysteine O-methyltransferase Ste14